MADTTDLKSVDENREGSSPSSGTFQYGDKVKVWIDGKWEYGEITVTRETESKILFDNSDLEYWYYPNKILVLVEKKEK